MHKKIFHGKKQKRGYYLVVKDLGLCDHEMVFSQFSMKPTKFEEL